MTMKKNYAITALTLIIVTHTIMWAPLVDDIGASLVDLEKAGPEITQTEESLKTTNTTLNNELIAKLSKTTQSIEDQKKQLTEKINGIEKQTALIQTGSGNQVDQFLQELGGQMISKVVQGGLCFAEVIPILASIRDELLTGLVDSVAHIKNDFVSAIDPLDPSKDSQQVYASFEDAKAKFAAAHASMKKLHDVLSDLAEDL